MITCSIIPSHTIAAWLLTHIDALLGALGLNRYHTLEQIIYFALILGASVAVGWLLRRLILLITRKFVRLRNTEGGRELLRQRVLTRCSHIIPPLVFLAFVPFAFAREAPILHLIIRIAVAYWVVMLAIAICAVLRFAFLRYNSKENTRNLPLRGVLNVAIGIVWGVTLICAVSVLVDKSPAVLLTGLTAFAAALMLIFKDSILGFVAGIQMSQNDMLRVGDWIVVPSTQANGIVEDVSLSVVKVRNFDNTLVMVPPYTLVSTSFVNWRGMQESGIRRIQASLYVVPECVVEASEQMRIDLSAKYPAVAAFIKKQQGQPLPYSYAGGVAPLNGSVETNLGLFRAYMIDYLLTSPVISQADNVMVRVQAPEPQGVPLQIYCFSKIIDWMAYEAITSAILEHALSVAPDFGLTLFSPSRIALSESDQPQLGTSGGGGAVRPASSPTIPESASSASEAK